MKISKNLHNIPKIFSSLGQSSPSLLNPFPVIDKMILISANNLIKTHPQLRALFVILNAYTSLTLSIYIWVLQI